MKTNACGTPCAAAFSAEAGATIETRIPPFFTTCTSFSLYRVYTRSMDSYQDFSSTRFGSWRIFVFQHF